MAERNALDGMQWELAGFDRGAGRTSGGPDAEGGGDWFAITFPATVGQAHRAAGRELPANWASREWWYRCRFAAPAGKDRVVRLGVLGVDYHAVTYLNGEPLGERKGAFGPSWFDVSGALAEQNVLAICVNPIDAADDAILNPGRHPVRRGVAGFPAGNDAGAWDSVELRTSGPVYFEGWLTHGEIVGDHGDLAVRLDINNTRNTTQAVVRLRVEGNGIAPVEKDVTLELATGRSEQDLSIAVPGAAAWNPAGHGKPVLYTFTAEVKLGGGVVDSLEQAVAFRSIKVNRTGTDDQVWRVMVNARPLQLRGVNWAALPLPAGASLESLVEGLAAAGVNAVRVWGGRHRSAFYDLCDRHGLLILQEFPLGLLDGAVYPRETPDFPQAKEIVNITRTNHNALVRHLRNHPSIFLWVGGTRLHNQDNAHVMRTVEDALRTEDGSRPYLPTLPNGGCVLDNDILTGGFSPEHYEDAGPMLMAHGLPAWGGDAPPEGFPARWRKYGGVEAQARALAWAAGGRRVHPTAGGFLGEVIDWDPDGGFGLFDFAGKARPALAVLAGLYAPVAAGLSFPWESQSKGTFEAEVWGARDDGGRELSATVEVVDAKGVASGRTEVKGALENGRGVIGEVSIPLTGAAPFAAVVQAAGGKPVRYPLSPAKPPSSHTLAEVSSLRLRLAVQTTGWRFVRDIGIYGLFPVEYFLRGLFAVRVSLGM